MAKTLLEEAVDYASHLMRTEGKSVLDAAHMASDEFGVPFGEIVSVLGSRGGKKSAALRLERRSPATRGGGR